VNIYMICTLWTPFQFRLKGTDKIHTEGFSKFHSNIYSILFGVTTYRVAGSKSNYSRPANLKKTDNFNSFCAREGWKKCQKKGQKNVKKYFICFKQKSKCDTCFYNNFSMTFKKSSY